MNKSLPNSPDRRQFLAKAGVLSIGASILPSGSSLGAGEKKVRHACIGVGGMGYADFTRIMAHPAVEIVAVCDVDVSRSLKARELVPNAKYYQDWRELLANEDIDSINVSVPDHMHASITMEALKKGRHVYCQKPLTHDIYEARRVGAKAIETGLITQMGTQITSTVTERQAVSLIQSGAIGKVKEAFMWSNKPPLKLRPTGPRPEGSDPVPESLNWDAWLGSAPERPYKTQTYHPTFWRGWQDFGCGWLGDMGCHIMDMPFRSLELSVPESVKADVEPEWADHPERRSETFPRWQIVEYTYPGTKHTAGDSIKLTWLDGDKYPDDQLRKLFNGQPWPAQGSLLIGEKGTMLLPYQKSPELFLNDSSAKVDLPEMPQQHHYHQFIDAVLGKDDGHTHSPFSYASQSTEMVLMGTIALRFPGQTLKWDAAKMSFPEVPAANQFVKRDYRKGWEVEGL